MSFSRFFAVCQHQQELPLVDGCSDNSPKTLWSADVQLFECLKCPYTYKHVVLYCRICHTTPSREGLASSACNYGYRLKDIGPTTRAQCIKCTPFFKRFYLNSKAAVERAASRIEVLIAPSGHGGAHIRAPKKYQYIKFLPENDVVDLV